MISPDTNRGKWPMGRIKSLYPGKDGHVRVVKVTIGNKEFVRPISRLCPLESDIDDNKDNMIVDEP